MASLPRPAVLLDILEEHLEELDFLWSQREGVINAFDWNLSELAELEERAEAHLDGLRLAGEHTVELAVPLLGGEEKWAATAATLALMALDDPATETKVLEALASAGDAGTRDGIRIGLRHSDVKRVSGVLGEMAAAGEPAARAAAADVMAFHRLGPPPRFAELFGFPDPGIRTRVFQSAGRFGGPWSPDNLREALDGSDHAMRLSALVAAFRLGSPGVADVCRAASTRKQNPVPEALEFLGLLGEPQDLALMQSALGNPGMSHGALAGLGAMGRVQAIPALIESMRQPKLALDAGAAFTRITGARGINSQTPLPPPDDLSEEDKEFWGTFYPPDPERARVWWEKEKGRFPVEGRWQAGLEVGVAPLGPAFRQVSLRARRDLYLCERVRNFQKTPDLELERRARAQTL